MFNNNNNNNNNNNHFGTNVGVFNYQWVDNPCRERLLPHPVGGIVL